MRWLLFGWLAVICLSASAERELTYSQMFEEIEASSAPVYVLRDARLVFDRKTDGRFFGHYVQWADVDSWIEVDKRLVFQNVSFEGYAVTFQKIRFNQGLNFSNCTFNGFMFWRDCEIRGSLVASGSEIHYWYFVEVIIDHIQLPNNKIKVLQFLSCTWPNTAAGQGTDFLVDIALTEGKPFSILSFQKCVVEPGPRHIRVVNGNFAILTLEFNRFDCNLLLNGLHIERQIRMEGNTFSGLVDGMGFRFPLQGSWVDWSQLEGRLAVSMSGFVEGDPMKLPPLISAADPESYMDEVAYRKLLSVYSSFYFAYKQNLDSSGANACYIEMKDIENRRLRYLSDEDPSFSSFFAYQINHFLKVFSDYGTNPSRAVMISFYVILIFALLYLLFPSSWDAMDSNQLRAHLRMLIGYFRSEEGLADLHHARRGARYEDYLAFKTYLDQSEREVPYYFQLLSKPLFQASVYRYRFEDWFLTRTELLNGRWLDLPRGRRTFTAFVVGCWLTAYLLFALVVKLLNALTLSINTFTTLGFGSIPTSGLGRYLAIIQGFIGWFMLTIFSVSLINQVLQ